MEKNEEKKRDRIGEDEGEDKELGQKTKRREEMKWRKWKERIKKGEEPEDERYR